MFMQRYARKFSADFIRRRVPSLAKSLVLLMALAAGAQAQLLPPEAVDLSKVKIEEKQSASELCPVALTAPDPAVADFEYQGVRYRFSSDSVRNQFMHSPQSLFKLSHVTHVAPLGNKGCDTKYK